MKNKGEVGKARIMTFWTGRRDKVPGEVTFKA